MQKVMEQAAVDGFISFYKFQQIALYHPEIGYYTKTRSPFGRAGDFYTAPGVHRVFGETLAKAIMEITNDNLYSMQDPFYLVEYGAGDGRLAESILTALQHKWPDRYKNIMYLIIELSERSVLEQKERLFLHKNVVWHNQLPKLKQALILSNEFVDALPIHLLEKKSHKWAEVGIRLTSQDETGFAFQEETRPLQDIEILNYAQKYGRFIKVGHRMEVNLQALQWMKQLSEQVQNGFCLTIDYGLEIEELYPDYLQTGTIRGYSKHEVSSGVFDNPGEMDLTHDVNFTALQDFGTELGFEKVFLKPQTQFLTQFGILDSLQEQGFDRPDLAKAQAIKHLLLGFPPKFQVLLQKW